MTKILVIEDDEAVREVLCELLRISRFDVIIAANGHIGVQMAQKELPDLIVCDIMMPELDGYGVLQQLRQNSFTSTIPFIFLTAKAAKADLRQGMKLGADDYLTKPFTKEDLLGAIATRLEKQAAINQHYTNALKRAAQELNHLFHYDSLTKLPNQLLLKERFNHLLTQASSSQDLIAILSVDWSRVKHRKDTLEHLSSDLLIRAIAKRLTSCIGYQNTVARLNAGDFAILLTAIHQEQDAARVAQAILDALSQPFILEDNVFFIKANIGIAFYTSEVGSDIENLIKNARTARYYAQNQGENNYQFHTSDLNLISSKNRALEASLYNALERKEFQLYYQPQVSLHTGEIVGAEALLRWHHPKDGLISPIEFISIVEDNGLITPIGEWVLWAACAQIRKWQSVGFHLRVAVNLSSRQFNQKKLNQKICQILKQTGLAPKHLEIELTESTLIQDIETAFLTLSELQSLGIQISIDDFGTGYSSLSYLKNLPFNNLKIDQCFVRNITVNSKEAAIVTAIIQMAHNLNLKVTAEGVETEAELTFLKNHHCDEIQGHLFSRPLPASEFEKLLLLGKRLPL